ncbi:DNA-binding transcriptional LysR family regulator [Streptomyces albogriseolus]|uniref:DNA-binding transcriptional LysR family regulator n=1 Tax=Streptomyces albogriseolus TaxID=1887 RepID=A0ACC6UMJ7_STRAO
MRAGAEVRVDLAAADPPGKLALVATGHAVALVPGVLARALCPDVTPVPLVDPRPGASTRSPLAATRIP